MAHYRPSYNGTVAKIMSLGGFKVKYMIRNGENMPEIVRNIRLLMIGFWYPRTHYHPLARFDGAKKRREFRYMNIYSSLQARSKG